MYTGNCRLATIVKQIVNFVQDKKIVFLCIDSGRRLQIHAISIKRSECFSLLLLDCCLRYVSETPCRPLGRAAAAFVRSAEFKNCAKPGAASVAIWSREVRSIREKRQTDRERSRRFPSMAALLLCVDPYRAGYGAVKCLVKELPPFASQNKSRESFVIDAVCVRFAAGRTARSASWLVRR